MHSCLNLSGLVILLIMAAWLAGTPPAARADTPSAARVKNTAEKTVDIDIETQHLMEEWASKELEMLDRIEGLSARLWHQAGDGPEILDKTIDLLRLSVATDPVEQWWLIDLADRLVQIRQHKEALSVMARTRLAGSSEPPALCYRGALVWIKLQQPRKALPVLEFICKKPVPEYAWLASLVRLNMELAQPELADVVLLQLLEAFPGETRAWKLAGFSE